MSSVALRVAVAAAAGLFVLAAAAVAGALGAVAASAFLWLIALAAVRVRIPGASPRRHPGRLRTAVADQNHRFATYRDVERHLWPAGNSQRMFDHATRPLLTRVTRELLRDRAGVELAAQPERARALLGPGVWPLVVPSMALSDDSHSPGVRLEQIDALLTRLEEL